MAGVALPAARRTHHGAHHEMRGGQDYDSEFATRMKGGGLWAELIGQRFEKACQHQGFNRQRVELDLSQFRPPGASGQGRLF